MKRDLISIDLSYAINSANDCDFVKPLNLRMSHIATTLFRTGTPLVDCYPLQENAIMLVGSPYTT